MEEDQKSILNIVADISDFCNSVAEMLCGHRKILVDGGFNGDLVDNMCFNLHAKLLGLFQEWENSEEEAPIIHLLMESEDDDE